MKRLLLMLFLMILPVSALADAAVPPPGDATARRLEALRYTLSPAVSLTEADMQALLKNDLFDAPLKPSDLFETDADFGPTDPTANPPRSADFPDAVSLDRDEAFLLLTPGSAYTLTDPDTGTAVRVLYAGAFGEAAIFQPATGWDGASLGSIFSDCYDFRVIPCLIGIGSETCRAGLSITPADVDTESRTPLLCRLYFENAAPALGALSGLGLE